MQQLPRPCGGDSAVARSPCASLPPLPAALPACKRPRRVQTRRKEEQLKLQKRAASIARDVRKFWERAHSVVNYMVREQIDAHKRQLLDAELDVFVGQSEKISKMLVERKKAAGAGDGGAAELAASGQLKPAVAADDGAGPSAAEAGPSASGLLETGALAAADAASAEADGDWRRGSDGDEDMREDSADDEATLEAEEALAAAAGEAARGAAEAGAPCGARPPLLAASAVHLHCSLHCTLFISVALCAARCRMLLSGPRGPSPLGISL